LGHVAIATSANANTLTVAHRSIRNDLAVPATLLAPRLEAFTIAARQQNARSVTSAISGDAGKPLTSGATRDQSLLSLGSTDTLVARDSFCGDA
jgi:hypothetical protein